MPKPGFTLVEILILLIVVFSMVLILLTTSGTLRKSRSTNLSDIATKIASCEIERLRGISFNDPVFTTNLGTPQAIAAPCNADISKLPASSATRTVTDYGSSNIKQITINVSWTGDSVQVATLKSKYGI